VLVESNFKIAKLLVSVYPGLIKIYSMWEVFLCTSFRCVKTILLSETWPFSNCMTKKYSINYLR